MPPQMLVVGSVAFDTLHFSDQSHPRVLGGSATYAVISASHFTPVQLVGVVGRDFPQSALQMLRERRVDLEGLEIADGDTFHWEGRYSDDLSSRETVRTELNVFADFDPKVPESYRSTPYVMLGNIDPVQQLAVLDQLDGPRLVVADTMNLWIDIRRDELRQLMKRIDMLVLNDEEARQLTGQTNLVNAAREMQDAGPPNVIIKKGEHGAMLFEGDEIFALPALPLAGVVDPTGAGDSFAGGLLGHLTREGQSSGRALRKAVVYGSVLASFCVEGVGTERLVIANASELEDRFERFGKLTDFS